MNLFNWLSFTATAILLTFMPGPDIMYLLARSLCSGTRQGVTLAAGLATGPVFHTTLVVIGVAAFIQESPTAFRILTYAGAAYILYLAWGAFRAKPKALALPGEEDAFSKGSLYRRGLIMNALNPKVLLFFLALLPQFVDTSAPWPPSSQLAMLGATFSVQAFCCFSLVAFCAGKIRDRILRIPDFSLIMSRVEGSLLTLIAAGLLFL